MKNLSRHIEALLQDNDCVVVPNFGGFVARTVPARYVDDDRLYLPPSRTVAFNERLSMNDGLLVGRYMHEHQVSYADATRRVEKAVDELRTALAMEGTASLPGIGCLRQDIHSLITFEPEAAGIASPALFGLDALSIHTLDAQAVNEAASAHRPAVETTRQSIDIHIGRRALRTVAAVAAVALLLILFAIPTADEHPVDMAGLPGLPVPAFRELRGVNIDSPVTCPQIFLGYLADSFHCKQMSSDLPSAKGPANDTPFLPLTQEVVNPDSTLLAKAVGIDTENATEGTTVPMEMEEEKTATTEQESTAMEAEQQESSANEAPSTPSTEESIENAPQSTEPATETTAIADPVRPATHYHIIVSSLPSAKGSEELVARYAAIGFKDASVVKSDDRFRISVASYTDKAEADAALRELREGDLCKHAWLLTLKN